MPQTLAILLCADITGAQDYRAQVQGQVLDPSGAAVAGANIASRSTGTGAIRSINQTGRYIFDFVTLGSFNQANRGREFQHTMRLHF